MTKTKRYESTTKAESLQIQQADKLAKDRYSFWHDDDPIAVFIRMMLPSVTSGILSALLQLTGWNPVLILMVMMMAIAAFLYCCWRYPDRWHRLSFLGCMVVGFVFAVEIG